MTSRRSAKKDQTQQEEWESYLKEKDHSKQGPSGASRVSAIPSTSLKGQERGPQRYAAQTTQAGLRSNQEEKLCKRQVNFKYPKLSWALEKTSLPWELENRESRGRGRWPSLRISKIWRREVRYEDPKGVKQPDFWCEKQLLSRRYYCKLFNPSPCKKKKVKGKFLS